MQVAALEVCDRVRVRHQRPREGTDVVLDYADAYRCGLITEPLDVFREKGTERYIVADGENRLLALRAAKIKEVDVRLHEGDEVAALDFAIGCNQSHGLRRTKADKYHAFVRIMETPTLKSKYPTDTDLSEKIGVSKRTIADYKVEWRNSESSDRQSRRAKEDSKAAAKKFTGNGAEPRTEVKKKPKADSPSKPDKAPRPAPKSSDPPQWSREDEQGADAILEAVSKLGKAWKAATRPAQIHTRDVIVEALRDMR